MTPNLENLNTFFFGHDLSSKHAVARKRGLQPHIWQCSRLSDPEGVDWVAACKKTFPIDASYRRPTPPATPMASDIISIFSDRLGKRSQSCADPKNGGPHTTRASEEESDALRTHARVLIGEALEVHDVGLGL